MIEIAIPQDVPLYRLEEVRQDVARKLRSNIVSQFVACGQVVVCYDAFPSVATRHHEILRRHGFA